jgi:hypothetical protein
LAICKGLDISGEDERPLASDELIKDTSCSDMETACSSYHM